MNKHNLKVGQRVFIDHSYNRGKTSEYEITKIGRKWAEFGLVGSSRGLRRFDLETLRTEGNKDQVWFSLEVRDQGIAVNKAWSEFRHKVDRLYHKPEHVTLELIQELQEKLRV